jgi:hypothetical protein
MTSRVWILVLAGLTLAAIVAMALVPRIPQDPSYHNFADQRALLGVPNFLNVVSNLPFLAVGIAGLLFLARPVFGECFPAQSERPAYLTFFLGIALTCFGSAYYHLAPSNERLVWDRLPMSIAFMSLLAAIISERIDAKAGVISLLPLLMLGAGSVIYWYLSEQTGTGDLRPYVLVQFYSGLAIALIALVFPSRQTRSGELFFALIFYGLAKVFELLDSAAFNLSGIISGHTLKHLAAAVSAWCILRMIEGRVPKPSAASA